MIKKSNFNKERKKIVLFLIFAITIFGILTAIFLLHSKENLKEASNNSYDLLELNGHKFGTMKDIDGNDIIILQNEEATSRFAFPYENGKISLVIYDNEEFKNIRYTYYTDSNEWFILDNTYENSRCIYLKKDLANGSLVDGDNCPGFYENLDKYYIYLRIGSLIDAILKDKELTINDLINYVEKLYTDKIY